MLKVAELAAILLLAANVFVVRTGLTCCIGEGVEDE
jgi:hypothetical protein